MFENNTLNFIEGSITRRPLTKVLFNKEGDLFAASGLDGTLSIFSVLNLEPTLKMISIDTLIGRGPNSGAIKDFDISEDSKNIVFIHDKYLTIENLLSPYKTQKTLCFRLEKGHFSSVRFLSPFKLLISSQLSENNTINSQITIIDISTISPKSPSLKSIIEEKGLELEGMIGRKKINVSNTIPIFENVFNSKILTLKLPNYQIKEAITINNSKIVTSSKTGSIAVISINSEKLILEKLENVCSGEIKELKKFKENEFLVCLKNKKIKIIKFEKNQFLVQKKFYADFPINSVDFDLDKNVIVAVGGQDAVDVAKKGGHRNFEIMVYDIKSCKLKIKFDAGFFSPLNSVGLSALNKMSKSFENDGREKNLIIGIGVEQGVFAVFEIRNEVFEKSKQLGEYFVSTMKDVEQELRVKE